MIYIVNKRGRADIRMFTGADDRRYGVVMTKLGSVFVKIERTSCFRDETVLSMSARIGCYLHKKSELYSPNKPLPNNSSIVRIVMKFLKKIHKTENLYIQSRNIR